ncbi:MAG: YegP family protein [Clostridia bacterium]|nr:YegP family protein [Clostridia bacterium]
MGKFVIRKTNTGIKFDLLASNHEVIATSEVYSSKSSCQNGIESVRTNCKAEIEDQTLKNPTVIPNPKFEVYLDKKGEYRFRLKARNGENIATSEGYSAKSSCLKGIESIRKNAPTADVEDTTLKK